MRRRRLVEVQHRVGLGTQAAVEQVVSAGGGQINPSCGERLPLASRQHGAAGGQRGLTRGKGEAGWRQQLALYHGYDNFCWPHASVRPPLPQPVPTTGTGSATQGRPWPPALAAGGTDPVWTLREG